MLPLYLLKKMLLLYYFISAFSFCEVRDLDFLQINTELQYIGLILENRVAKIVLF